MIAGSDERVTAFPGSESGRLRLAIPNKGRMQGPSLQLLHDAGLRFEDGTRALTASVEGFPLDILFVRTDDIVEFVADGVADLGITGTNLLIEAGADLETLAELGYGYCRLEAAVPNESPARSLEDLAGMRLATSHPHATETIFAQRGIEAEIVTVSGAVEVAPTMGLADGVVDLVSSGSTLIMNGLRSVGPLFASQAILVGRRDVTPQAAAAIRSPMVQEQDVERISRMRTVHDEVLRIIAGKGDWIENHTIKFNIAGARVHTINVTSALPTIGQALIIDGLSGPDYAGSPVVRIDASRSAW